MAESIYIIERQKVMPNITGRGRPKGTGFNQKLLGNLGHGDSIWEVPRNKMNSIRVTAHRMGIKVQIRKQPNNNNYAIKRL